MKSQVTITADPLGNQRAYHQELQQRGVGGLPPIQSDPEDEGNRTRYANPGGVVTISQPNGVQRQDSSTQITTRPAQGGGPPPGTKITQTEGAGGNRAAVSALATRIVELENELAAAEKDLADAELENARLRDQLAALPTAGQDSDPAPSTKPEEIKPIK